MRKHIFGPVPSRRLGRSLGVDLVPFKTCTFDCIYCQLGRTTRRTTERKEWVPPGSVLSELECALESRPDYITLSGSGEPTLQSGIGELIRGIRKLTDTPVAVLTNGSLLHEPAVRGELLGADLVVPSLDAGDAEMFDRINRPDPGISFTRLVEGMIRFRQEYRGRIWLEVFLLDGINTVPEQLGKMREIAARISPDMIQLNTVDRPPAEDCARPATQDQLREIAREFGSGTEVIARQPAVAAGDDFVSNRDEVLELIRRRAVTVEDIERGLGLHPNESAKYLRELLEEGLVRYRQTRGRLYYCASGTSRGNHDS